MRTLRTELGGMTPMKCFCKTETANTVLLKIDRTIIDLIILIIIESIDESLLIQKKPAEKCEVIKRRCDLSIDSIFAVSVVL